MSYKVVKAVGKYPRLFYKNIQVLGVAIYYIYLFAILFFNFLLLKYRLAISLTFPTQWNL